MVRQLVVFDFDWSLIDQDTDRYVFEVLAPDLRRYMKSVKDDVQWTDLVYVSSLFSSSPPLTSLSAHSALKRPMHVVLHATRLSTP